MHPAHLVLAGPFLDFHHRRQGFRRRCFELKIKLRRCMNPRVHDIVRIAAPRNRAVFDRAAVFFKGHHIRHYLAWVRLVRQAVYHRNSGMGGHVQQLLMIGSADHDDIDIALQHAGGIGNGLTTAQLHGARLHHNHFTAQLAHADFKRNTGAG